MKTLRLLLPLLLPMAGLAAEIPAMTIPAGVGVNIHFVTGHQTDLDKIAAAGFKFVRMDFSWQGTEHQNGVYDWSGYDELTANLEKRGLRAIYIFDYSNPLHEETVSSKDPITGAEQKDAASPQHPESIEAFARWSAAASKHFAGHHVVWEIWNEPNISFWKPKPDVKQYTALALATAKAVRESDPAATLIGPASSEFPWEFMESFLASGILDSLDAVSVHPYRDYKFSPETAAKEYQRLRGLIERFASTPEKKKMPIISGEWGYATHTKGVSIDKQAAYIVRQQLSNLLNGIPLSIWYDWKNDGTNPEDGESNFGTVLPDLSPKPAYVALQSMTRQLSGYHVVKRLTTTNEADFLILWTNAKNESKLTAWTAADSHPVTIDLGALSASQAGAKNWKGEALPAKIAGQKLQIDLDMMPVYLTLERK